MVEKEYFTEPSSNPFDSFLFFLKENFYLTHLRCNTAQLYVNVSRLCYIR
ncbi:hypothetical protein Hanom_Chr11g01020501 [Helianthus anomalus]